MICENGSIAGLNINWSMIYVISFLLTDELIIEIFCMNLIISE